MAHDAREHEVAQIKITPETLSVAIEQMEVYLNDPDYADIYVGTLRENAEAFLNHAKNHRRALLEKSSA